MDAAGRLADRLTDAQVMLLAIVTDAMSGSGIVPRLSLDEWEEAERLYEMLEDEVAA